MDFILVKSYFYIPTNHLVSQKYLYGKSAGQFVVNLFPLIKLLLDSLQKYKITLLATCVFIVIFAINMKN